METTETVIVKKQRQVRVTFEGLQATVNVKDSDDVIVYSIDELSDEIRLKLLQYGWKQKVSDYRASDKLQGEDKAEAIGDCHKMLANGDFTQKRESNSGPTLAEQKERFQQASESDQEALKRTLPELYAKLTK